MSTVINPFSSNNKFRVLAHKHGKRIAFEELCKSRKVTKELGNIIPLPFGRGLVSIHRAKEVKHIGVPLLDDVQLCEALARMPRRVAEFPIIIPKLRAVDSMAKVEPVFITREKEEVEYVVTRKFDLEDIKALYQELSLATQNLEFKWGEMRVPNEITSNLGLRRIGSGAFSECFEVIGCLDKSG